MEQVHPTEARAGALLGQIGGMEARAKASGEATKKAAAARLEAVNKRLEELRPTALTSSADADEYQGLIVERARLHSVVMAP